MQHMLNRVEGVEQVGLLNCTAHEARRDTASRGVWRIVSGHMVAPAVLMGIGAAWTLATLIRPHDPGLADQIDSAK